MKKKAKRLKTRKQETQEIYCALTTGTMIHILVEGPKYYINTKCGKQFKHGFTKIRNIDKYKKCPFCFKK